MFIWSITCLSIDLKVFILKWIFGVLTGGRESRSFQNEDNDDRLKTVSYEGRKAVLLHTRVVIETVQIQASLVENIARNPLDPVVNSLGTEMRHLRRHKRRLNEYFYFVFDGKLGEDANVLLGVEIGGIEVEGQDQLVRNSGEVVVSTAGSVINNALKLFAARRGRIW